MLNIFAVSSIITFISNTIITIFIFYTCKNRRSAIPLGIFSFIVSIWGLASFKFSTTLIKETAFFWWQIGYITTIFSSPLYYHFVYSFLELKDKYHRMLLLFVYILGGIFLIFTFFARELFLGDLKFVFNQFYWTDWLKYKSPLWMLYYITFDWLLLTYAFLLLIKNYLSSVGIKRSQIKYFITGSILGWIGAHGLYLLNFKIEIYPYTNFLIAIYPAIWAYAIIKYRLLDITIAISNATWSLIVYSFAGGIPFYLGYRTNNWMLSTSTAVVLAIPAPMIYRYFQRKTENILLAEQRRYQQVLLQAAGGMTREYNLSKLAKLIVYIVKKTIKIDFCAIFLEDKGKQIYTLKALRAPGRKSQSCSFVEEHHFIQLLIKKKEPLLYEELPDDIKNSLRNFHFSIALIVPAMIGDKLVALLLLGQKLNKNSYSNEDINVFKILAYQTALAIENCIFVEEFKDMQEKMFAAEKLASIGGLADGVAHQIKNRLNHFSILSGELKLEIEDFIEKNPKVFQDNPSFKTSFDYFVEIAESLVVNVKRTDDVVRGILDYARVESKENFFSQFHFKEVVDLSLELLKVKHHTETVPLELEIVSSDMVYGVKSQLMEAVYNILDNAYEAIQEKISHRDLVMNEFIPQIKVKCISNLEKDIIEISDNGSGIKDEDKQKIFAPFFSTKSSFKSGTGIGMYIVKRIVEENHKGKITFKSEYMKGTRFLMELPKK